MLRCDGSSLHHQGKSRTRCGGAQWGWKRLRQDAFALENDTYQENPLVAAYTLERYSESSWSSYAASHVCIASQPHCYSSTKSHTEQSIMDPQAENARFFACYHDAPHQSCHSPQQHQYQQRRHPLDFNALSISLHTTHGVRTEGNRHLHSNKMSTGVWSGEEHDQFLEAIKKHPEGPWRKIAECIPTRSLRQVQTHAQKYHEKVVRRMRGLRKDRRKGAEHRIDDATLEACRTGEGFGVVQPKLGQQQLSDLLSPAIVAGSSSGLHGFTGAGELPSFDESLDFLIEYLATEALSSDEDLDFDIGDVGDLGNLEYL